MSLFHNELVRAATEKKFVRFMMHDGSMYCGYIINLDDDHIKIAHLDAVNNSDQDSLLDLSEQVNNFGDETGELTAELADKVKELDFIFCESLIRIDMINKLDINVGHSLRPETAKYVDFWGTNSLTIELEVKKTAKGRNKQKDIEPKPRLLSVLLDEQES